jgi:hypothetical protein
MIDLDFSQRLVLGTLLRAHPRMLGLDDLHAELDDVAGVVEAVRRLGDRVGASRAAVRYPALGL